MLAVMAEMTRMHSSPSRKTSTPISRMATPDDVCDSVGSGAPEATTPCQTSTAATISPATINKIRSTVRPTETDDVLCNISEPFLDKKMLQHLSAHVYLKLSREGARA